MKTELKSRLETMRAVKSAIRQRCAWPGCYPISIITDDGELLCPDCARENYASIAHDTVKGWSRTGWSAVGTQVLWEGGNRCAHCCENLDAYPTDEN